jgi:GMP synthase (glutamine-hydrolysing)
MRAIILTHMPRESPGRIVTLAARRGLTIDIRQVDQGDPVPARLAPKEILIVMGGSMGVTDIGDPRYPFLAQEIALLKNLLAARAPVLGVCLGAQLLAHAAGSRVYPNTRIGPTGAPVPAREVGFGKVRFLDVDSEPVLVGLRQEETVLHWHGDTFDLPTGATHLAESEVCPNQAFRIGQHAFGLQFHVEVDAAMARNWAQEDADFVIAASGPDGPARIMAESEKAASRMHGPGDRLLSNILAQLAGTSSVA